MRNAEAQRAHTSEKSPQVSHRRIIHHVPEHIRRAMLFHRRYMRRYITFQGLSIDQHWHAQPHTDMEKQAQTRTHSEKPFDRILPVRRSYLRVTAFGNCDRATPTWNEKYESVECVDELFKRTNTLACIGKFMFVYGKLYKWNGMKWRRRRRRRRQTKTDEAQ